MATAEFEELKLSVVLVDDASSGLAALRAEMRNFNTDSIRFLTNARGNAEAYKRLGRETDDVVKGLRAAGTAFSRAAGVIGVAVGSFYKVMTTLSTFALEVEQVANAAQLAGVTYADLRNVSEQLARKGLGPESAGRVLGALNNLGMLFQIDAGVRDFQQSIRNSKIVLKPEQEAAFIRAFREARGWQERNAIVQNALRNIEKKGIEDGLDDVQIKIAQKEFLTKSQLPEELLLTGDLTDTTKAQKDKYNKFEEISKLWTEIIHKIIQNVNTIIAIFNADSMAEDGPFYLMLTTAVAVTGAIDKNLGSWLESISEAAAWLAKTFGGSPEGEPSKPGMSPEDFEDRFREDLWNPMGGDDDVPLKLEKLIKEFRAFENNLRGGGAAVPRAPLEQHASLGSMATPGLQQPPAAQAGDIYTRQYPQWPGGGGKPYGSDAGPGRGPGAGGGALQQGFGGGGASGGVGGGPIIRPWKPGDPQYPGEPTYKGKPFPTLSPEATPLPTRPVYDPKQPFTDVSEGRGVATWFGQGKGWGDDPRMDKPGSNVLGVPESLQGISLSSPATVGQFFYVTDPNTGLTSVQQQTDTGPGVRTQKLVDVSVAALQKQGYTKESFEKTQGKALWDVRATGFGTGKVTGKGASTQTVTGGRLDLPTGMDLAGDQPSPNIPTGMDLAGDMPMDRSVLDRGMGNEMGGKLDGGIGLSVNVKGPSGTEAKVDETSGIINRSEVNRETSFGAD